MVLSLSLALVALGNQQKAIPQQPKGRDTHFRLVISGRAITDGGGSADVNTYKADDGTLVEISTEIRHSAPQAEARMSALTAQAKTVIESEPKIDNHGKTIGRR